MEIKRASVELNARQKFKLMNGKCEKMSDNVGSIFNVVGFVECETEDNKGNTIDLYVLIISDGGMLATNSATAKRSIDSLITSFGNPTPENPINDVTVISGESRNGRTYIDVDLVLS